MLTHSTESLMRSSSSQLLQILMMIVKMKNNCSAWLLWFLVIQIIAQTCQEQKTSVQIFKNANCFGGSSVDIRHSGIYRIPDTVSFNSFTTSGSCKIELCYISCVPIHIPEKTNVCHNQLFPSGSYITIELFRTQEEISSESSVMTANIEDLADQIVHDIDSLTTTKDYSSTQNQQDIASTIEEMESEETPKIINMSEMEELQPLTDDNSWNMLSSFETSYYTSEYNESTTEEITTTTVTTPTTTNITSTTSNDTTTDYPEEPTEEPTTTNTSTSTPNTTTTELVTESTTTNTSSSTQVTLSTSTTANITTSTTPVPGCRTCNAVDNRGRPWSVCIGTTYSMDCGLNGTDGRSSWTCLNNGSFATDQPDYSGCRSQWLIEYETKVEEIANLTETTKFLVDLFDIMVVKLDDVGGDANYFGHEIGNVSEILGIATKKGADFSNKSSDFEPVVQSVVKILGQFFSFKEPWLELKSTDRSNLSTNLIDRTESTSLTLTEMVNINNTRDYIQNFATDISHRGTIFVSSYAVSKNSNKSDSIEFPDVGNNTQFRDSLLRLPSGWRDSVNGSKIECIGTIIGSEYANIMMPGQFESLGYFTSNQESSKILNGNVMGFTVASRPIDPLDHDYRLGMNFSGQGVQISFRHTIEAWGDDSVSWRKDLKPGESPKAAMGTAECVYWTENNEWSSQGCKRVSTSKWDTVCECNHLTSFAVLMQLHTYKGHDEILQIMTYCLCSISMLCLLVSIIIFATIPNLQKGKSILTRNLCICLLIGNILVVSVLNLYDYTGWCIAAGIVIHYIFLSAFCWMLLEGIYLYTTIVSLHGNKDVSQISQIFALIFPALIVGITVAIGYGSNDDPYGGEDVCWLNGNYRWSFLAPVAVFVFINLVILLLSLRKARQFLKNRKFPLMKRRNVDALTWVKGCTALSILLGLTWIIGFFAMIPGAQVVLSYFFVVLNASQGIFIFIFHILLNDTVHQGVARRYERYLPISVTKWLSSTSSRPTSSMA